MLETFSWNLKHLARIVVAAYIELRPNACHRYFENISQGFPRDVFIQQKKPSGKFLSSNEKSKTYTPTLWDLTYKFDNLIAVSNSCVGDAQGNNNGNMNRKTRRNDRNIKTRERARSPRAIKYFHS